jgi:hypothetical protein
VQRTKTDATPQLNSKSGLEKSPGITAIRSKNAPKISEVHSTAHRLNAFAFSFASASAFEGIL